MELTQQTIRQFLRRYFPIDSMDDDDDIFEAGFVNSLFIQQVILFIERQFNISIPDGELNRANFKCISAMTALVGRLSRLR